MIRHCIPKCVEIDSSKHEKCCSQRDQSVCSRGFNRIQNEGQTAKYSKQVIPTVGVDGENADRNKRAMLKHFRNLVDETASKASFLAAFKRSDSSKTEALARAGSSIAGKDSSELPMSSNAGSDSDSEGASGMEDGSREPSGNVGQDEDGDCEMAEVKAEEEGSSTLSQSN